MTVSVEDKIKVKQYNFEKEALEEFFVEFLSGNPKNVSNHVANAVESRLRVVNRELKILGK